MKSYLVCTLLICFIVLPAIQSTPLRKKAGVYQPWVGVGFLSRIMGFYPKSLDRYKSNQYFYSDYEAENQDTGEYLYDSFDYVFDEPYVAINEYRCWYCW